MRNIYSHHAHRLKSLRTLQVVRSYKFMLSIPDSTPNSRIACHGSVDRDERPIPKRKHTAPAASAVLQPNLFTTIEATGATMLKILFICLCVSKQSKLHK